LSAPPCPGARPASGRSWIGARRRLVSSLLIVGLAWSTAKADSPDEGAANRDSPAPRPVAGEPAVETLCRAAVALALAEPERARSFINRARAAGWLPELRFRVFRRFARTEGLTLDDTSTTTPVDVSAVDDVRYEWRATWDLSRMVFNPDELQAHAEALRMSDVRRDIQSLVIRLYFERRRLLASGGAAWTHESEASEGGPAGERRHLRVLELEAQLEALSGMPFFTADGSHEGARPESPTRGEAAH